MKINKNLYISRLTALSLLFTKKAEIFFDLGEVIKVTGDFYKESACYK